ncbi:hypothetical protein GLAREA_01721 [Glarea lozoyensis ATCC 20868]|uniref:Maintenance of telomere capping protein 6 n=1 Tax=Glarea lozoyensis (strain ATCC 20868 / MF5171) TaxID=1116229 RepID=S3CKU9_GLAL2|nr:uncharacterized protein GLAREA_01721 [Glarea lozoyensis ATCC 20868]EPE25809.1 hypothetical protein GLAREA_01721 [Glarea lozoyensis ATCC 20868]
MTENYSPSPGANQDSVHSIAFLSQRDLGLAVPVNFVSSPLVSLSAACFPFNRFEDADSADCISNLLAVGFRRFAIDLYWDQARKVWSFCPAAVPTSTSPASSVLGGTQASQSPQSTTASLTSVSTAATSPTLQKRQDGEDSSQTPTTSSAPVTSDLSSVTGTSTGSGETQPTATDSIEDSDASLISIGPYSCTTSINLSTLITQLRDYFIQTDDTINASLLYFYINVHAAAPTANPLSSPPSSTSLPSQEVLIGNLFGQSLSDYIYTPTDLAANRRNVNGSWLTVAERYRPAEEFYTVTLNEFDQASTKDGWPSESYIEFSRRKRLLLGWGSIDPQLTRYNFSGDASNIFPQNFITKPVNVTTSSTGQVTSGCFIRPNTENIQVAAVNTSWATASVSDFPSPSGSDLAPVLSLTSNLTACGISPVLNSTLLNVTARQDFRPYQSFAYASIWSWASSEPQSHNSSNYRCALTSTSRQGRWIVADCRGDYYAACRASRQPYNWTTSSRTVSYESAEDACPSDFEFAAPRTALENSFLTQAMVVGNKANTWVDFNAIDRQDCWVMGGADATCPYKLASWDQDYTRRRAILVPTVAACITLLVTALTIFVKAAGNRKTRKRTRKRAVNGFVYEGVPS